MKTSDLTGAALEWAVAIAHGWTDIKITGYDCPDTPEEVFFRPAKVIGAETVCESGERWRPSTHWAQGGPLVEREGLWVRESAVVSPAVAHLVTPDKRWYAYASRRYQGGDYGCYYGETFLVAAMRCYVASKLGVEVDVPKELATMAAPAARDGKVPGGRSSDAAHDQPTGVLRVNGEDLARQAITMLADLRNGYRWDDLHRDFAGLVDEAESIGIDLSEVEGLPGRASGLHQAP